MEASSPSLWLFVKGRGIASDALCGSFGLDTGHICPGSKGQNKDTDYQKDGPPHRMVRPRKKPEINANDCHDEAKDGADNAGGSVE